MNKDFKKYFGSLSDDEFLKLACLPFISEEGKPCILIRNAKEKTVLKTSVTDNLEYRLNTTIEKNEKEYYFHLIICKNKDEYSIEQFEMAYEYLFKKIKCALEDIELLKLISSLEELFRVTSEKDKAFIRIGMYGELLFCLFMFNNGYIKIFDKYHSNFYSKHDIEINYNTRIEIKTTIKESRIHLFKHDQLYRKDLNVFIGSVLLEPSEQGKTLYDLFSQIINLVQDPEKKLEICKLKGMCGISADNRGPSFSFEKAMNEIRLIKAEDLPHLEIGNINGVTDVSYNVECGLAKKINVIDIIKEMESK